MSTEEKLAKSGLFKNIDGLRGLLNSQEFWDSQPYGTRLYYGNGISDYLHRDVLRAIIKVLDDAERTYQCRRDAYEGYNSVQG